MNFYDWDESKNEWLQKNRGVSFEKIIVEIESGNLLDVVKHPNQKKYKGQFMYIVKSDNYIYCVPFVVNKNITFLKTIYPSRKVKKQYEK